MRAQPLLAVLVAACGSVPGIPEGEGQGVLAFDEAPPVGVQTFDRPQWHSGDRVVYLRGGLVRDAFTVEASDEGYRLVNEATGLATVKNLDLWDLGQELEGVPQATLRYAPGDPRFHWPLWVGKEWTSHFLRKQPGRVIPVLVSYRVEAEETVEVPAGSFRTLRILRSDRPATEGNFFPRQTMHWYAPEVGLEVRWLVLDRLTELAEYQRQ